MIPSEAKFKEVMSSLESKFQLEQRGETNRYIDTFEPDRDKWIRGIEVKFWNDERFDTQGWDLLVNYEDLEDFSVFSNYVFKDIKFIIEINERDDGILEFDSLDKAVEKLEEFIEVEMKKRGIL